MKKRFSLITSILALLQFTTRLPLGRNQDFDAFAISSWLYPLAGYITGGITAGILILLPLPGGTSAAIALILILILTGANHFDGLLDLGDGLMAHGDRSKRITALTDQTVGAGGVAAGASVMLLMYAALSSMSSLMVVVSVLYGEVFSRYAMAWMTVIAPPFHDGIHSYLHSQSKKWFLLLSTMLLVPLILIPEVQLLFPVILIMTIIVSCIMRIIAIKAFGGANGDVVGATGEITRSLVFLLIAMSATGSLCISPVFCALLQV